MGLGTCLTGRRGLAQAFDVWVEWQTILSKIEVGVVIAGMRKQGVEATEKMTLRELASALQMRPREAVEVIKKAAH